MKKFLKVFLALGLTAALLSTSVYGEDMSDEKVQDDVSHSSGDAMSKNFETGEISYVPAPETSTYSNATEGTTEGYDPYEDVEEGYDFTQTYMTDNRIVIPNPEDNAYYRKMVYIYAVGANGAHLRGTGFMIGPNAVATAGHIVFNKYYTGTYWAQSITVAPAASSSIRAPYGLAHATGASCGLKWAKEFDDTNDWGIVFLDTDFGSDIGWCGLHWQSDSYNGTSAMAIGYPKEFNNKSAFLDLVRSLGKITESYSNILYSNNICASQGESGGPCCIRLNGNTTIIGLIQGGNDNVTRFIRLDESLFKTFAQYNPTYSG